MAKEPPAETSKELVERFGFQLAEQFKFTLDQLRKSLTDSQVPAQKELRKFLLSLSQHEREIAIARLALENFIHDLMAIFDESDDFKIVGTLRNGTQFDLRELCPEGLHGNQLDWLERYTGQKSTYETIFEINGRNDNH